MARFLTCWILFAVVGGCSSEEPRPQALAPDRGEVTEKEAEAAEPVRRAPRIFDADGRLVASKEYVVGIPMPRGAELFRADEIHHVYRIRAPIDKVLAYFGPLMITGNVERLGKGAVYKRSSVRGAEFNPTKVDLSILEVGSNLVRISVTELPPAPAQAPSAAQTNAAASKSWRMLD